MKAIRLHWTLHDEKIDGLYYDENNKPRSLWYDNETRDMTPSAVARELDINYDDSVEGIVFSEFSEKMHVYRGPIRYNPSLPVIRYFDYGACCAAVFSQLDNYNRLNTFHEIVIESGGNAHKLANAALAYSNSLEANAGFRDFDDPAGKNDGWVSGNTSWEIMNSYGFNPTHFVSVANKARRTARIELIHKKLNEMVDGQPCIQIHEGCKFLIEAYKSGYRHPIDSKGEVNLDDIDEVHPYEDVMDCHGGTMLETMSITGGMKKLSAPAIHRRQNKYTGY